MSGVESVSIPSSDVISASFVKLVPINAASISATTVNTTGAPPAGKLAIVDVYGAVAVKPVPLTKFKPAGNLSITTTFAASNVPSLLTVISYVT